MIKKIEKIVSLVFDGLPGHLKVFLEKEINILIWEI